MSKDLKLAVGEALRTFREARGHSQEGLGVSQSYVSTLENGGRWNVTIARVDQIGDALGVHPLSILSAAYCISDPGVSRKDLLKRIEKELSEIGIS